MKKEDTTAEHPIPPMSYGAIVIDGGILIHSLIPKPTCTTCNDFFTTIFYAYFRSQLHSFNQLHIVWDRYFEHSIKAETRSKRGGSTSVAYKRALGATRVPYGPQLRK